MLKRAMSAEFQLLLKGYIEGIEGIQSKEKYKDKNCD